MQHHGVDILVPRCTSHALRKSQIHGFFGRFDAFHFKLSKRTFQLGNWIDYDAWCF